MRKENLPDAFKSDRVDVRNDDAYAEIGALSMKLSQHNDHAGHHENWRPLAIFIWSDEGEMVGGLNGHTHWAWLYVQRLWVTESRRGHGYGRKLLSLAEEEALRRGCTNAYLDTHSFQAPAFYQKLGYRVFTALADFPYGETRYFLRKTLAYTVRWY